MKKITAKDWEIFYLKIVNSNPKYILLCKQSQTLDCG